MRHLLSTGAASSTRLSSPLGRAWLPGTSYKMLRDVKSITVFALNFISERQRARGHRKECLQGWEFRLSSADVLSAIFAGPAASVRATATGSLSTRPTSSDFQAFLSGISIFCFGVRFCGLTCWEQERLSWPSEDPCGCSSRHHRPQRRWKVHAVQDDHGQGA